MRDDILADRRLAEAPLRARGRLDHTELALDQRRIVEMRRAQQPRPGKLPLQQGDPRRLVERRVSGLHAGALHQLGHDRSVLVRALPEIDRREVEAEHAYLPAKLP